MRILFLKCQRRGLPTLFLLCMPFFQAKGSGPEITIYPSLLERETPLGRNITLSSTLALQKETLEDALKQIPGVSLTSLGAYGPHSHLKIRGANTDHTKVQMWGVPLNDPSAGDRFDFSMLFPEDNLSMTLEPSSDLSAIGGVVDIEPRRAGNRDSGAVFGIEGGSFRTGKTRAEMAGKKGTTSYFLSGTFLTAGEGKLKNKHRGNEVADCQKKETLTALVEHSLLPAWGMSLYLSQGRSRFGLNRFNDQGLPQVSSDRGAHNQGVAIVKNHFHPSGSPWEHDVTLSSVTHRNRSSQALQTYTNKSLSLEGDYKGKFHLSDHRHLLGKVGVRQEQTHLVSSGRHFIESQYVELAFQSLEFSRLLLEMKGRLDHHKFFKTYGTYRGKAKYLLTSAMVLFGSCGTAFKAPTAFDLYASGPLSQGNPALKPLASQNMEVGVEFSLPKGAGLTVTYFHLYIKNLLVTLLGTERRFQRVNASRTTEGLETFLSLPFLEHQGQVRLGYTLIKGKDEETQKKPLRLPRHQGSLRCTLQAFKKTTLFMEGFYTGTSVDGVFSFTGMKRVGLSSSFIIRAGGSYTFNENFTLKARVENLFNKSGEGVYGFPQRGISFFIGAAVKL